MTRSDPAYSQVTLNVTAEDYERLKSRAEENYRSMSQELRFMLDTVLRNEGKEPLARTTNYSKKPK